MMLVKHLITYISSYLNYKIFYLNNILVIFLFLYIKYNMNISTLDELEKISTYFDHKIEFYTILSSNLEKIKIYLIELNKYNIELTRNSLISLGDYKNNNDYLKVILDKKLSIKISYNFLTDDNFLKTKTEIDKLKNDILENCNILALSSIKNNLNLLNLNFENDEVNFYEKYFKVINFKIIPIDNYLEKVKKKNDKYIFFDRIDETYKTHAHVRKFKSISFR